VRKRGRDYIRYWRKRDSGALSFEAKGYKSQEDYNAQCRRAKVIFRAKWGSDERSAEYHLLRSTGKRLGLPNREAVKTYLREHGL